MPEDRWHKLRREDAVRWVGNAMEVADDLAARPRRRPARARCGRAHPLVRSSTRMPPNDDVEAILAGYRAWNAGRPDAFLREDVEWIAPPEVPGGGRFVGRAATLGFLQNFEGTMGVLNLSFEVEEIIPAGGRYLVVSVARGKGESGVAVPAHNWFHLMTLQDGRLRRAQLFLDRAQALAAAGLAA